MCPDILRWAATNRSAAGSSHGDQQVFDTDGVFFDKAELPETMVAGLRCVLGSRPPMAFAAGAATLRVFGFGFLVACRGGTTSPD